MDKESKPRIVFMGTPKFGRLILQNLFDNSFNIVGVFCQPDRKFDRKKRVVYSEVKDFAVTRGLPYFQPENFKSHNNIKLVVDLCPDFLIVAAYGLILPQAVLDIPYYFPINVHASLLPKYRGAAPIQRAIMDSWDKAKVTGISIMKMVAGMDKGPIFSQAKTAIEEFDYSQLEEKLALLGGKLLTDTLRKIGADNYELWNQDDSEASYANKITSDEARINWEDPIEKIDALVRAINFWPCARTKIKIFDAPEEFSVKILKGKISDRNGENAPGDIIFKDNAMYIACKEKWYKIEKIKPDNKHVMTGLDFLNGKTRQKKNICGRAF